MQDKDMTYLNGGVYAYEDGNNIVIVDNIPPTDMIYLNDEAMLALIDYWRKHRPQLRENENT